MANKKYKVQWNYVSSLGGPWEKGAQIDLDEEMARRVNVDSPGVLVEFKPRKPRKKKTATTTSDRQVKAAKTRKSEVKGE